MIFCSRGIIYYYKSWLNLLSVFQLDYWFYLKVYIKTTGGSLIKTRVYAPLEWIQLDITYPRYETVLPHIIRIY